jgi:hypothetical protein
MRFILRHRSTAAKVCGVLCRQDAQRRRLAESHPQIDFRFFVLLSQTTERLSLLEFYTMNVDLLCWFWDEVRKDNFRGSRSATLQLQLALSSLFSCTSVQFIFSNLLFQSSVFSTTTRLLCALPDGAGAIWRSKALQVRFFTRHYGHYASDM